MRPTAPAARRPNLVFIMSDDHASHAISAYGSRINRTPHLARIAQTRQFGHDARQDLAESAEIRARADRHLVHIQRPVDLDLDGMLAARGATVMLRDKGPGKGRVASHDQSRSRQDRLDPFHDFHAGR